MGPFFSSIVEFEEMIKITIDIKPYQVSIVPEKRQEITTEGGLNVLEQEDHLINVGHRVKEKGILYSLFIDPDPFQVEASKRVKADSIELNTGPYSESSNIKEKKQHIDLLEKAAIQAHECGLKVFAGHGLTKDNISAIVRNVPWVEEFNIGHHIISHSIYVGMEQSVKDMINSIKK